MVERESES